MNVKKDLNLHVFNFNKFNLARSCSSTSNPCKNGGVCVLDKNGIVSCTNCSPNYYGTYCEILNSDGETLINSFTSSLDNLPQTTIFSEKFYKELLDVQSIISSKTNYYNSDLVSKLSNVVAVQMNLIKQGLIEPNLKMINLLDLMLDLNRLVFINKIRNNNVNPSGRRNLLSQTEMNQQIKLDTLLLAQSLIKSSTAEKNVIYNSKLISIQLASTSLNTVVKEQAQRSGISVIDFTNCETKLKQKGIISQTDSLFYLKIDWNPSLKIPPYENDGITKTISVTYELLTTKGLLLETGYCLNEKTIIQIPLISSASFDLTNFASLLALGYNIFDPNDLYYTDRCIINKLTDSTNSILSRRNNWNGISLTCSTGCKLTSITTVNSTTYLNCECYTNSKLEVGTLIEKSNLSTISSLNNEIVKCYKLFFSYVSLYYKIYFLAKYCL